MSLLVEGTFLIAARTLTRGTYKRSNQNGISPRLVAAAAAGVLAGQAVQAAKDAGAQATVATAAVAALSVRVTNVLAKIAALSKLILRLIKKAHA